MPNCLTDFIGLRSCSSDEPLSGVWINDYPGMSTELLDKVASQDQITFAGVWESVQRQAFQKLRTMVQDKLLKFANARMDQVIFQTSKIFNQQWQQIQTIAPVEKYKGVLASIAGGKYLALRVKNAYVYNAGDAPVENVDILYYQSQDAKLLYSKTVTLAVGMNIIPINQVFTSEFDKINILQIVDCTNLTTIQGPFLDYGWGWASDECASRYSRWFVDGYNNFPISAPLDYGLGNNWVQDSQTVGIYWDAELICSLDAFICAQKYYLIDVWARLLCAELLRTKLASQRVNYFTQSNREITERNQATFMEEMNAALEGWAMQLNLQNEGLCFDCEDSMVVKRVALRP